MKPLLQFGGAIVGIVLALCLVVVVMRQFSAITTSVKVIVPEEGVHCALASTSDGTALACWQIKQ